MVSNSCLDSVWCSIVSKSYLDSVWCSIVSNSCLVSNPFQTRVVGAASLVLISLVVASGTLGAGRSLLLVLLTCSPLKVVAVHASRPFQVPLSNGYISSLVSCILVLLLHLACFFPFSLLNLLQASSWLSNVGGSSL
ncbi:unnamed protein product [Calypogeia fissa]